MLKAKVNLIFLVMLLVMICSCSLKKTAIQEVAEMARRGQTVFEQEENLDLVEKALPANIKFFEVMLENDPGNPDLSLLLARMYGSYGFAFAETRLEALSVGTKENMDQVVFLPDANVPRLKKMLDQTYLKGLEHALRSLESRHEQAREELESLTSAEAFFKSVTLKDAPALFWYGFNLGGWVNLNRDSVEALAKVPWVEKAMLRVAELDPDYFQAGAHLSLLALYGSRPPLMGGDPRAAKRHYEEVRHRAGEDALLAEVLYARTCLVQAGDREEFEKRLQQVLDHKAGGKCPFMNQVARVRAEIYLKGAEDLFP